MSHLYESALLSIWSQLSSRLLPGLQHSPSSISWGVQALPSARSSCNIVQKGQPWQKQCPNADCKTCNHSEQTADLQLRVLHTAEKYLACRPTLSLTATGPLRLCTHVKSTFFMSSAESSSLIWPLVQSIVSTLNTSPTCTVPTCTFQTWV